MEETSREEIYKEIPPPQKSRGTDCNMSLKKAFTKNEQKVLTVKNKIQMDYNPTGGL